MAWPCSAGSPGSIPKKNRGAASTSKLPLRRRRPRPDRERMTPLNAFASSTRPMILDRRIDHPIGFQCGAPPRKNHGDVVLQSRAAYGTAAGWRSIEIDFWIRGQPWRLSARLERIGRRSKRIDRTFRGKRAATGQVRDIPMRTPG
jgi:hypothetical protein